MPTKTFRFAKRQQKYTVVGGTQPKKTGRVLSRHRTLRKAKESAKRYKEKGYHGAIWKLMKGKPPTWKKRWGKYRPGYWHKGAGTF